jgi:uncharacterized protein YidB (DUF937 family)/outer membrane protein OmpA-like peptidoglycan-associated protein
MALFDSIIGSAREKFGLSDEGSGSLVAALLALITDPRSGGFGGFIDRFRGAGLGSIVDSWISTGGNEPLTGNQVESALGADAVDGIATRAGVDRGTASAALGGIIPSVVDTLTPDGTIPDDASILSRIGGFISEWGGAIGGAVAGGVGAAAAAAGGAADRVGDAAGKKYDKGKEVLSGGLGTAGNVAGSARDKVSNAYDSSTGGSGSALRWILPLLLLALVLALGFWFCGRSTPTTTNVNVNASVNRSAVNANANARPANANANGNSNVGTNANANANGAGTARTLSEVSLPNGTKLKAYAGGIEDQLVKFIESADYKNGTNDSLKDKWFNFDDLNFVFGKTELTPESKRQLDNIVAILKAFPDAKIKIGGYTDKKGDDAANKKLSDARAKAVQAALQKAGVGAQVPEAEGYGEQYATVEEGASDEARAVDRKTAVRLMK